MPGGRAYQPCYQAKLKLMYERLTMSEKMKTGSIVIVLLTLFLVHEVPLTCAGEKGEVKSTPAEKGVVKTKPEKEEVVKIKAISEENARLTIGARSATTASIDLTNSVPVRGIQFTVEGVKMTEARTTDRTKGFLAKFNAVNGVVIMVSTSNDSISPGKGAIVEVVCDKPDVARLTGVKIAGTKE